MTSPSTKNLKALGLWVEINSESKKKDKDKSKHLISSRGNIREISNNESDPHKGMTSPSTKTLSYWVCGLNPSSTLIHSLSSGNREGKHWRELKQ